MDKYAPFGKRLEMSSNPLMSASNPARDCTPNLPGLGIDLDEAACAAHPVYRVEEMDYHFRTAEEMAQHQAD